MKKKTIEQDWYEPDYHHFKSRGAYPANLLFGYENELEFYCGKGGDLNKKAEKVINRYPFLYAKDDCSLDYGCEFNTHPFNMNWFRKKNIINYIDELVEEGFRAKRSCGFHVHLSRDYFKSEHELKMVKMFYGYPDFITKVSQRASKGGMSYSVADIGGAINALSFNLKTLSGCRKVRDYLLEEEDKYVALNFLHDGTLEVRIFQGTINKKLIQAYLEFCLAITLFTQKTAFQNVTPDGFRAYVRKNRQHYKHLIGSGILGKKVRKSYAWRVAA